jgi:DDE_Tnp_1-associated/Transposase DDE domain
MEADVTLMELLEGLHDPRAAKGKRHPLPALLTLAVVAMLAGMTSYEAIVQYGQERGWEFLRLLGFTRRRGLCKATYSRVFRRLDVVAFEAIVSRWIRGRLGPDDAPHLAIDGKSLRGSRDSQTPAVHLLAAYAPDVQAVVAQLRVDAKTNELKAALEMLAVLPIKGRIITADAIQTHREICATVIEGGGDYILPVKDNQPTLRADIEAAFAEPEAGLSPPPDRATPGVPGSGHDGRQGAWPDREADAGGDDVAGRILGRRLAGLPAGVPPGARAAYG